MGLKIIGTGRCLPARRVTNDELAAIVDTSDEWIVQKTGISSRHICTDESLADIAGQAALNALAAAGADPGGVDLIICSTVGGDYLAPSLACRVAHRIGAACPAFDINAACAGFIYALDIAAAYLAADAARRILVVSAERMSSYVDWSDRTTCVLFGDGAGACLVTGGESLLYSKLTVHNGADLIEIGTGGGTPFALHKPARPYLRMDGPEVFRFAVQAIEREVHAALDELDMAPGDIDHYVLHQANKRIIDGARARLNQPSEKFPVNINKNGNTSSATIPILLDEMAHDARLKPGDTLLLSAFGAGLTTGTAVLKWE